MEHALDFALCLCCQYHARPQAKAHQNCARLHVLLASLFFSGSRKTYPPGFQPTLRLTLLLSALRYGLFVHQSHPRVPLELQRTPLKNNRRTSVSILGGDSL